MCSLSIYRYLTLLRGINVVSVFVRDLIVLLLIVISLFYLGFSFERSFNGYCHGQ